MLEAKVDPPAAPEPCPAPPYSLARMPPPCVVPLPMLIVIDPELATAIPPEICELVQTLLDPPGLPLPPPSTACRPYGLKFEPEP
ncbi:hypothetical protein BOTU111922_26490 [Bordetella tumulicola]